MSNCSACPMRGRRPGAIGNGVNLPVTSLSLLEALRRDDDFCLRRGCLPVETVRFIDLNINMSVAEDRRTAIRRTAIIELRRDRLPPQIERRILWNDGVRASIDDISMNIELGNNMVKLTDVWITSTTNQQPFDTAHSVVPSVNGVAFLMGRELPQASGYYYVLSVLRVSNPRWDSLTVDPGEFDKGWPNSGVTNF